MNSTTDIDLRQWKLFSSLSDDFLEKVTLAYVFATENCSNGEEATGSDFTNYGTTGILVTKDEETYSIGSNVAGLLGIGIDNERYYAKKPEKIEALDCLDIIDIKSSGSKGYTYCTVLTSEGSLYSWGGKEFSGTNSGFLSRPKRISFNVGVIITSFSSGGSFIAATSEQGDRWISYWNFGFRRGYGTVELQDQPTKRYSDGDLRCSKVVCGGTFLCEAAQDGKLFGCGENLNGVLDVEQQIIRISTQIYKDLKVKKVSCGLYHILILTEEGDVVAFGSSDREKRAGPIPVLNKGLDIAALSNSIFSVAQTKDGFFCLEWDPTPVWQKVDCSCSNMHKVFNEELGGIMHEAIRIKKDDEDEDSDEEVEGNNESPTLISTLEKALTEIQIGDDDGITDVTFEVGGRQIKAHKTILQLRNGFFRKYFMPPWSTDSDHIRQNNDGSLLVSIKDTGYEAFYALLHHIYTDKVKFLGSDVDDLLSLMTAADIYGEISLLEKCFNLIKQNLSVEKVAKIYCTAKELNHTPMKSTAFNFIVDNWKTLASRKLLTHQELTVEDYQEFMEALSGRM